MLLRLATIFVLVISIAYSLPRTYAQTLPFEDDFSDQDITDGTPGTWTPGGYLGATYDASSGDLVISANRQTWMRVTELAGLQDLSIRTQIRFGTTTGNGDLATVWARGIGDFGSYWAGVRDNGFLAIGRENANGTNMYLATKTTMLDPVTSDVSLRLDIFGNELSLYAWQQGDPAPSAPELVVRDDVWAAGGDLGLTLTPNFLGGSGSAALAFRSYAVYSNTTLGDFDQDGIVDGADLLGWQRGASPHPASTMDLLDWQRGFGARLAPARVVPVPEITGALAAGLAVCGACILRHRRPRLLVPHSLHALRHGGRKAASACQFAGPRPPSRG